MTHPLLPEADDLPAWRAQLLDRLLYLTLVASLAPCGLVSYQALRDGAWTHALLCWCTAGLLAAVKRHTNWPHAVRALGGAMLLYLFGLWLLAHGAAVGMLYLLAFPVMVALIMHTAAATLSLFVSTATLTGIGWWLQLPIPMVVGLPGNNLLLWVIMSSNLLLLGMLMTLAAGFLLRHLEQAMASHRHSATLLREVATQVPGMVFRLRLDDLWVPRFLFVSPGSQDVLDLPPNVLMADAMAMTHHLHPDDQSQLRALVNAVRAGKTRHEAELRVLTAQGQTRWLQMQATEVERQAGSVVLNGVLIDITARKQAEAMVQRQAYIDTLTGLPNRLSLQIELARLLDDAQRRSSRLALLLVDLDRFKEVNDTQGHAGGDALLVQAGQRLQACLGEGGFVARVGGDEFVLLLPAIDSDGDIETLSQRMLGEMSRAFPVAGQQCFVSASVGIAIYPDDAATADDLLIDADQAMYEAKASGRDRCSRFTAALHDRAQRRIRLAHELRTAIERNQLSLVYQPIVDMHNGQVLKAEALLRWQHPELGAVSPAEFIPIAESTGLIGDIGAWVLSTAAGQARVWRQTLHPAFRIGINHSPLQFRSEYAPALPWKDQLAALGVPGEALIVEITEGLLLDHSDALAQQLRELRASGVQVALDDFGTGYSALAYLHRFEIDLLKIDRSFVSGEGSSQTGRSLCRAMVALAQELRLQVVAEGVETAEQRDWLSGIGCHQAQGWLYGRGMPPAEFERWYARHTETQALPA